MKVVVHVDGGARGNPGPAAAAAVVSDPDGTVLDEAAERVGTATNNVAEYRGLLLGLERARALGADRGGARGRLRARRPAGRGPLQGQAPGHEAPARGGGRAALEGFERWSIRTVPREQNARADALVNEALDGLR